MEVKDIDLTDSHISLRQTGQRIKRKDQAVGEWVFDTSESRRSTRNVPLLDRALIADLKRLKTQHRARAILMPCSGRG